MNKAILFTFALAALLILSPGIASAYNSPCSGSNFHSPEQKSFYTEADFIDPWGHQVVAIKKYNKPHYTRTNIGCSNFPGGYLTYRSPYVYHYKNVKFSPEHKASSLCGYSYRCSNSW